MSPAQNITCSLRWRRSSTRASRSPSHRCDQSLSRERGWPPWGTATGGAKAQPLCADGRLGPAV